MSPAGSSFVSEPGACPSLLRGALQVPAPSCGRSPERSWTAPGRPGRARPLLPAAPGTLGTRVAACWEHVSSRRPAVDHRACVSTGVLACEAGGPRRAWARARWPPAAGRAVEGGAESSDTPLPLLSGVFQALRVKDEASIHLSANEVRPRGGQRGEAVCRTRARVRGSRVPMTSPTFVMCCAPGCQHDRYTRPTS